MVPNPFLGRAAVGLDTSAARLGRRSLLKRTALVAGTVASGSLVARGAAGRAAASPGDDAKARQSHPLTRVRLSFATRSRGSTPADRPDADAVFVVELHAPRGTGRHHHSQRPRVRTAPCGGAGHCARRPPTRRARSREATLALHDG